jgi:hypothetical protein
VCSNWPLLPAPMRQVFRTFALSASAIIGMGEMRTQDTKEAPSEATSGHAYAGARRRCQLVECVIYVFSGIQFRKAAGESAHRGH